MKVKVATSILCKYRGEPDAACRRLPRCRVCGKALHPAEVRTMTCAGCRQKGGQLICQAFQS